MVVTLSELGTPLNSPFKVHLVIAIGEKSGDSRHAPDTPRAKNATRTANHGSQRPNIAVFDQEWEQRENPGLVGGGGGIRTHETLSGLTVFKTAGVNRFPTPP